MPAEIFAITLVIQVENSAGDLVPRNRLSYVLFLEAYIRDLYTALAHVRCNLLVKL